MGESTIEYRKKQLHFNGNTNIIEMFKSLQYRGYMQVEEVAIAGSMNGALAALMWA